MKTLIQCSGASIGEIWIPPFQVRVGEVVCLRMPCLAYSEEEEQIIAALVGDRPTSGIQGLGKTIWTDPEKGWPQGFWQRLFFLFFRPRFSNWLEKTEGFRREQTKSILERHGVGWDWRLGSIPWTSRNLIAMEVAWAKGADVVVFSTIALDCKGVQALYQEIDKHSHHSAAIELSYIYSSNGQKRSNCHPGATCLEVILKESAAPSLTISG